MVRKVFTDQECPKCKSMESEVWGHEDLHVNDRVCKQCRWVSR